MTLRTRLTLWYTAVLMGVLALFGAAVYLLLAFSLTSVIEDTMERTADDLRRAFVRDVRGIILPQLALDLTADVYVQLWDASGALVDTNLPALETAFDEAALRGEVPSFSSVVVNGVHLRVLTYPLLVLPERQVVGYLQLANSLETVDRTLESLVLVLFVGGVVAVGAAALVGWTTAETALRPLEQVTDTALQISRADDLSRRIPMQGEPRDEVGQLVQAFNETIERLEKLFESQRRFLADVSHELRTPLTAIRGNVDLIRRMGVADSESLDAITSEVDRMTRMVRDLLLLAQAESGKLPLAREDVELDTLLLEVFHQAKVLAQERVEVRLAAEDQVRVKGDRDRLKQVVLNLVANALEHTPPGGSISLGLACVGEWARLTVSDTGSGIPKDELPRIFERFYRMDRSRRRSAGGGAGLGLSIAYWLTRGHQGRLEVDSEVGKGTTFSVWLPRVVDGPGGADKAVPVAPARTEGDRRQGVEADHLTGSS